jgi:uncharacterized protein YndB with AHSA1/START domain
MTSLFGSIARVGAGYDLEFERVLATDVQDLWSAITERDRLARWMNVYTGDLRLGGIWQALLDDGSVYCTGTVTECDPPRSFRTTWHAIEEQPTTLTVAIEPAGDGARLLLRHEGVQSIYYGPGWQAYLEQLDDYLGAAPSSEVDPTRAAGIGWEDRFTELRGAWDEQFGSLRTPPGPA